MLHKCLINNEPHDELLSFAWLHLLERTDRDEFSSSSDKGSESFLFNTILNAMEFNDFIKRELLDLTAIVVVAQ